MSSPCKLLFVGLGHTLTRRLEENLSQYMADPDTLLRARHHALRSLKPWLHSRPSTPAERSGWQALGFIPDVEDQLAFDDGLEHAHALVIELFIDAPPLRSIMEPEILLCSEKPTSRIAMAGFHPLSHDDPAIRTDDDTVDDILALSRRLAGRHPDLPIIVLNGEYVGVDTTLGLATAPPLLARMVSTLHTLANAATTPSTLHFLDINSVIAKHDADHSEPHNRTPSTTAMGHAYQNPRLFMRFTKRFHALLEDLGSALPPLTMADDEDDRTAR
ncbi:MAG: hypothetical protein HQL50_11680 [Magnetococcales bacterium]|nr:hypothetical protein [Magnetococcales bacterium]